MSRKTDLIILFGEYKGKYEAIVKKIKEVEASDAYTEVGREQAVNKVMEDFSPIVKRYHDTAIESITEGLEALSRKWKSHSAGRLQDNGYQTGLSNVFKMLEIGAIREKDDIQNIIDNYKGDYNALAMIKDLLQRSTDEAVKACTFMIPQDNREKNKRLLEQLMKNVNDQINIGAVQAAS